MQAHKLTLETNRRVLERQNPWRLLRDRQQLLDELRDSIERRAKTAMTFVRQKLTEAQRRLHVRRLFERIRNERKSLELVQNTLVHRSAAALKERTRILSSIQAQLRLLGPEETLQRGYSITLDAATKSIVRNAKAVKSGSKLETRLASGEIESIAS
jgi:exodeoxyribonuclease VII large subunit